MSRLPNPRLLNVFGLGLCVTAFLFAVFYLQGVLGLEPCPLCIIDRVIVLAVATVLLVAIVHNPGHVGRRVYGGLTAIGALVGMSVAGRHIWLQNLPPDQVPACGADLSYMLENYPLFEALKKVLRGTGECAEIQWTFLGITIPEQTLIVFVVLGAIGVVQMLRRQGTVDHSF